MPNAHARALLVASTLLPLPALGAPKEVVRLASDEWCPYVCTGKGRLQGGFVVDVTTRALAKMGYRVEPQLLPLSRAMQETAGGNIDGVFAPPEDARLRPSIVLGYSRSCFFTTSKSSWTYRGISSLKGARLGVIVDYEYDNGIADEYIRANASSRQAVDFSYGARAGRTNVKKLLGGRFQVLLEHELVMSRLVRDLKVKKSFRNAGCLEQAFALRVGFAPHDSRSQLWLEALSEGMRQLEESGELDQIRGRYGVKIQEQGGPGDKPEPQS